MNYGNSNELSVTIWQYVRIYMLVMNYRGSQMLPHCLTLPDRMKVPEAPPHAEKINTFFAACLHPLYCLSFSSMAFSAFQPPD